MYRLLLAFDSAVAQGASLGFPTFKAIWQRMHFSHVFQVTIPCMLMWCSAAYGHVHRLALLPGPLRTLCCDAAT